MEKRPRRYVCIHGHFYQPPRENPWTGKIEKQPSAEPYHDWNERITAECYRTNSEARILRADGELERVVNNYSKISFNFGPSLLNWLESAAPDVYRSLRSADRKSRRRFSGHGAALAQPYHHSILPLASRRDKVTEVHWGIRDFEHRFGRKPEGIWLPETAADLETLEVAASAGLVFTVLSPHQAARVRPVGAGGWIDVSNGSVDTRRGYRIALPSGKSLALYFYDGAIARAVAFQHLLFNGESLATRLLGLLTDGEGPQLAHIATDGETYGHHHTFGEMALAYALKTIDRSPSAALTVYGEFLKRHPPEWEVEIIEGSSWSCAHGVERWRSDCGCQTGGKAGWNQRWRGPLRESLNWLRDSVASLYEYETRRYLCDPWGARDDYIELLLNPSKAARRRFFSRWAPGRRLKEEDKERVLKLLEAQRHSLMMFTSCGWFFHDISGIETIQVLSYAARLLELVRDLFGMDLQEGFLEILSRAQSNIPEEGSGRAVFVERVLAARPVGW